MDKHRIGAGLLKTNRILAVVIVAALVSCSSSITRAEYTWSDRWDDMSSPTNDDILYPNKARTKTLWATLKMTAIIGTLTSGLTLPFDLGSLFNITLPQIGGEKALVEKMKTTYMDNYEKDHKTLSSDVTAFSSAAAILEYTLTYSALKDAGAISFAGSSDGVGTRIVSQDPGYITTPGTTSSDAYRGRIGKWQDIMFADIKASSYEADGVLAMVATGFPKKINDASSNADGYLKLIQARHRALNSLNTSLVMLTVDVMRQTDVQFKFALEELQDDADETGAFVQAVNSWAARSGGAGY
ncbi:hypothetical protein FACS1894204_04440 [Synergistales bacterium]|nr:hypothetical protein FACS1894204_04440 [Synergistales bacterium]